MRSIPVGLATAILVVASLHAQETKPVPKGSVRVSVPGCANGYVFTAGARTTEAPGSGEVPEGTHLRMNGPKKTMAEIKAHEGAMIEITGLMKQGQRGPDGVGVGGVRIMPGATPNSGSIGVGVGARPNQAIIDLEGWRAVVGNCPTGR
jgi:hypothetical protein